MPSFKNLRIVSSNFGRVRSDKSNRRNEKKKDTYERYIDAIEKNPDVESEELGMDRESEMELIDNVLKSKRALLDEFKRQDIKVVKSQEDFNRLKKKDSEGLVSLFGIRIPEEIAMIFAMVPVLLVVGALYALGPTMIDRIAVVLPNFGLIDPTLLSTILLMAFVTAIVVFIIFTGKLLYKLLYKKWLFKLYKEQIEEFGYDEGESKIREEVKKLEVRREAIS